MGHDYFGRHSSLPMNPARTAGLRVNQHYSEGRDADVCARRNVKQQCEAVQRTLHDGVRYEEVAGDLAFMSTGVRAGHIQRRKVHGYGDLFGAGPRSHRSGREFLLSSRVG